MGYPMVEITSASLSKNTVSVNERIVISIGIMELTPEKHIQLPFQLGSMKLGLMKFLKK